MSRGGEEGGLSRRALLGRVSAGAIGAAGALGAAGVLGTTDAVGTAGALANPAQATAERPPSASAVDPFAGGHQAGIATPRPASLVLAAFDLEARSPAAVSGLLETWTAAIESLAAGRSAGPSDSGEALGLSPSALTITVGVGPGLFARPPGLARKRPFALAGLPAFPDDELDPAQSDGDLVVQACAEQDTVAAHAVRQLLRLAGGRARLRWLTTGFAPPAGPPRGAAPRNVLGFRDGSANPSPGSPQFSSTVWAAGPPEWLRGGTFLCYRKIRVDTTAWDGLALAAQQAVIGRAKRSGAPLSGGRERSPLDLRARRPDGSLAIPSGSHVRLASPALNGGATMYRRSFAYADGARTRGRGLDAGQLFLAFVADPATQFIPVLAKLSDGDRLGRFTTHVASGLWAVPPAPRPGGFIGDTLFG